LNSLLAFFQEGKKTRNQNWRLDVEIIAFDITSAAGFQNGANDLGVALQRATS
jgi:hypothetical protein